MKKYWKFSSSVKTILNKTPKPSSSPARRRYFGATPKRSFLLVSKSPSCREVNKTFPTPEPSSVISPKVTKNKLFFKPQTRIYLELSESPIPYDLRSKNLQKDIDSLQKIINYDSLEEKKEIVRKEYKKLAKKDIKRVEGEKEDLMEINFEHKKPHEKANEYFKEIKRGNVEGVISLLVRHPELIKEVDSTMQTGLHWAARRRHLNIAKYLISSGANCLSKDIVGRKPEDIARAKKFNDISEILIAFRRRTAQHVSRVINTDSSNPNNNFHLLMSMQTRHTKLLNKL